MKNQKQEKLKISFCTVVMNRLDHLSKTLPKNIQDNLSYGNVEFVVLNYNSKDGLDDWILNKMDHYIKNGILKYIKTTEPKYFFRSHAKNIAAKMATGDIVCNIDADNFTGNGFASYVNEEFLKDENSYLMVQKILKSKDCYGRICVFKKDFMEITGYDETMTDYGFEDDDLINRLDLLGKNARYITNDRYLKVVEHDDNARLVNERNFNEIHKIYYKHVNHFSSELIYLFRNDTYLMGTLMIDRLINSTSTTNIFQTSGGHEFAHSILHNSWSKGTTSMVEGLLKGFQSCNEEHYDEMVMFLSQISNRMIMLKNKSEKKIKVNEVFGKLSL